MIQQYGICWQRFPMMQITLIIMYDSLSPLRPLVRMHLPGDPQYYCAGYDIHHILVNIRGQANEQKYQGLRRVSQQGQEGRDLLGAAYTAFLAVRMRNRDQLLMLGLL